MRSLLFTRNPTKPLMKHGNVLKDSFVNVLTMAFRELPQLDTFNNSLNSKTIKMLRSAAVEILGQNASRRFSNYLKASQSSLLRRSANDSRIFVKIYSSNDAILEDTSTSNSGTLPSQTVTNPRQQINAITTRSGKALEEPSIPLVPTPVVSNPQKEPEQNPETSTEKVQNPNLENTAHVPSPGEEDSIFMELPKPMQENHEHAYYPNKSEKNKEKNFVHAISIDFSKEDPFSGSTTTHSDDLLYSSPVKTMINFGEVRSDELLLLLPFTTGVMMISTLKRTLHEENFKKMSN
ncbi:hypothetical protein Tco_0954018 [Tanacetum coccineum]|uniref:Uncharacterized protein n=1 Tax=Tanacetum coccineum TaxID=301880 RepID=A0ABQ5E371_9ASTR